MSYLTNKLITNKRMENKMLEKLQKDYDAMVAIAKLCDYDLTPAFQAELTRLMRVLKEMGGRV